MVIALSYDERRTGKGLPCMGRLPGIAGENHWTSVRIKVAGLLHHQTEKRFAATRTCFRVSRGRRLTWYSERVRTWKTVVP